MPLLPTNKQPDLLPKSHHSFRLLFFVGGFVFVLAFVFFSQAFPNNKETGAVISDSFGETADSSSVTPPIRKQNQVAGETAAVSLASGIGRDTIRWFEEETGRAFEMNLQTRAVRTVSDVMIVGFMTAYWVPGKDQAVVVSENPRQGRVYRFMDYLTGEERVIGNTVSALAISSDGTRIAYIDLDSGAGSALYLAAIDGLDPTRILRTRLGVVTLAWPKQDTLLLSSWAAGRTGTDLVKISPDGKLKTLLSAKQNLEYVTSRTGNVVVSYTDAPGGLSLIDTATGAEVSLNIRTGAHKCGWGSDNRTLVCGIPVEDGFVVDTPSDLTATSDVLVRIDIESGNIQTLSQQNKDDRTGVINPVISSSGTYVSFINLFDRLVHILKP